MAKNKGGVTAEAAVKKEKKKNPALRLVIFLVELVLLIAGVAGSIMFIKKYNDPQLTADNYFQALLAGDYANAYGYLELEEENVFLSQDAFAASMTSLGVAEADEYMIYKEAENIYVLDYGNGFLTIQLKERDEKRFFIFNDYEVVPQDFYVEDIRFTAPKDVTVSLNGIVLDSSNCAVGEESNLNQYETSYTIDKMFSGSYYLEVSGEPFQTYSKNLSISAYSSWIYIETPYLSNDLMAELCDRAYNDLKVIYQDAMNQAETCSVMEEAKTHEGVETEDLDYYFRDLKDELQINDGFFDYMNLSQFTAEIYSYYYDYESGSLLVDVELTYHEDYGYQQLDWWTESYYESDTDSSSGYADFYYAYIDGEWVLKDIYIFDGIYIW